MKSRKDRKQSVVVANIIDESEQSTGSAYGDYRLSWCVIDDDLARDNDYDNYYQIHSNQRNNISINYRQRRGKRVLYGAKFRKNLKKSSTSATANETMTQVTKVYAQLGRNILFLRQWPILLFFITVLLLSATTIFCSAWLTSNSEQSFMDPMPPFTPTRRPANNGNNHHPTRDSPQASPSRSSAKFARTNELDLFLDDMNHNELRTIASGQPINDLFHAKPVSGASSGNSNDNNRERAPPNSMDQVSSTNSDGSSSVESKQNHENNNNNNNNNNDKQQQALVESQSERQIYSECALILQRTYVKNIDDPKQQLVPFGKTEQACISYKHIDKAIEQAKHKLKFRELAKKRKKLTQSAPPGTPKPPPFEIIHSTLEPPEDLIAAVGEINMATTQIIADQFDLSNDELLNGLPLIDMSKTKFWNICPLLVRQDIKCEVSRFRSFTGHCNNLKHPTWGAAMTPFARYLPPLHPDGIWIPRKSIVTELTFHLGDGHQEMHANLAPTMPLPVFNSPADDMRAFGPDKSEANHLHSELDEEMNVGSSVHFLRRTRPIINPMDNYALAMSSELAADHMQHIPPPQPIDGERTIEHHYQMVHKQQQQQQHRPFHHQQPMEQNSPAATHQSFNHVAKRPVPQELPSARLVTSIVHHDTDLPSHDLSILFMSWGQLLDHDMTRAAQPPSSIKCCTTTGNEPKHKLCLPISVPPNDPFYSQFNVQCLEFRRSLAGVRPNCVLGPRVHQNAITSPIDANFVYGSSRAMADGLRLFKGGRLRDRNWFHREGLKPLLPAQEIEPDLECIGRPRDLFCFLAGDVRANEQTHLTVLHTLYMREHNRMADKLAELNPHWDDNRIYHETRHIMAAGVQHVMLNEYLPLLIGRKMAELYNLTAISNTAEAHPHHHLHGHHHHPGKHATYWRGYDPTVTTSVSNSFAAAAFRQGHTFIMSTVERYNKHHEFVASEKLRHLFKQPFLLYQPGVLDELTGGMINQASQSYDPFITEEVSGHLFQPPETQFGHDLAAINLQRGREQGLPGYNLFREWCGLPRAETFGQLEPYLTNRTAYHYSRLYKHVDDIDLWSGGISERKLPGAAIGPTFACIIARQFSNTRRGDRFWYENPGLPSSFTPDQLAEIRKISLAKILCANSDDLPTIQRWPLRMAHPILNPRLNCHSLPEPNLHFWQEE